MAAGEYCVCVSVAVQAVGEDLARGVDFGMTAKCMGIACFGMATDTEDLLRRRLVRKALDVLMAIDAGQLHGSMDRVLKLLAIHEKRDLLTADVFG